MQALKTFLTHGFGRGPVWGLVRALAVALFAWLLYQGLDHFGHGTWMIPIAVFVGLLWVIDIVRMRRERARNEAAWDRWEFAVLDDGSRSVAIQEVREELRKAHRLGPRLRVRQAHLSVILAELLDASGKPEQACDVLSRVQLDELEPARAAVVRHAKAVAQFAAERYDEAEATVRAHRPPSEPDVDARFELVRRMLLVERGKPEEALDGLERVLAAVPNDDTGLADDVRAVRAMAYDALGRHDDAAAELRATHPEILATLAKLGAKRVRAIAQALLARRGDAAAEEAPPEPPRADEGGSPPSDAAS